MPKIRSLTERRHLVSPDDSIRLDLYEYGDRFPLARILNDDRIWLNGFGDGPGSKPASFEECLDFIRTEIDIPARQVYTIRHKSGAFIGVISYFNPEPENARVEIGKLIQDPNFQRQGYMRAALRLLIANAFDAGYHRVYAESDVLNTPSIRALTSVGLQLEGTRRHSSFHTDGTCRDISVYALTLADSDVLRELYGIEVP